jgi:sigma-B regulation protein RsbU (phosphoserine phosphatase)
MTLNELLGIAIGSTLVALGIASGGAWMVRRRRTERLLLIFGTWCLIYGLRLLAGQPPVRAALGGPRLAHVYLISAVTYGINVVDGLFFEAVIGRGWKQSIRIAWLAQAAYAVAGFSIDLATSPNRAMGPNNIVVLAGLTVGVVNLWLSRRDLPQVFRSRALLAGVVLLLAFVVNENLGRPIEPVIGLEPFGIVIFVTALGYAVFAGVFRSEADLLAMQRELATARRIQLSLLPRRPPAVRGADVAVRYLPMTAVAGDLYDFAALGPSRLGVLVADVSGHGVPAALVASMVKLAFSMAADQAGDPARVLETMNRVLSTQLEQSFVTAIYALLDTDRGAVTVANAGHPPLFIGRANGAVDQIDEHGLMMGLLPQAAYVNTEMAIGDGDRLLFYTDGVTEARSPSDEFYDADRVKAWFAGAAAEPADRFVEAAIGRLSMWRGASGFDDDVTLVTVRVTAASAAAV